jgi:hypothetical protein
LSCTQDQKNRAAKRRWQEIRRFKGWKRRFSI